MAKRTISWTKMSRMKLFESIMDVGDVVMRAKQVKGEYDFAFEGFRAACGRGPLGILASMGDEKQRQQTALACFDAVRKAFPDDVFCFSEVDECRASPKLMRMFKTSRQAEPLLEKAEYAKCVRECLSATVNATRDHCEAKCAP